MSKTRKCPNCGEKMPENMRFCGACGTDMDWEGNSLSDLPRPIRRPNEPRPVETAIRPEKPRGARPSIWQYIIVLLIIAAVIAVAVMLVIKMNQPAEVPETSDTFDAVHVINADGEEITATPAPEPKSAEEVEAEQAEETEAPEPTEAPEEPEPTAVPESFEVTEVSDTVYVTGTGVNLRSGPGTTYGVVTMVSAGTELKRTGTTDNNWSRVQYNGNECYISSALVTTTPPEISEEETGETSYTVSDTDDTVAVITEANIRTGPGTSYDVLGTVPAGTELKRTGTADGWSRVIYNGNEAFVNNGLIRESEKTDDAEDTEELPGSVTVISEANIRQGPSTNDSILGVVQAGTQLEVTGKANNWYGVMYKDQEGYINGNLVSPDSE